MIILGIFFIILGIATFITGHLRSKNTAAIMEDFFEDEIFDDGSDLMMFGVIIAIVGLGLTIRWLVINRYMVKSFLKRQIREFKRKLREPKKKKTKHRHSELYYTLYYYKYKFFKFFSRKKHTKDKKDNILLKQKKEKKHHHSELYYTFHYYKHKFFKFFSKRKKNNKDKKDS